MEISGFSREELLGSITIVRHPDMPPTLFDDMWKTLRSDKPGGGLVKTAARTATITGYRPLSCPFANVDRPQGYMSVRSPAPRDGIAKAEILHRQLGRDGKLKKSRGLRLSSTAKVLLGLLFINAVALTSATLDAPWARWGGVGAMLLGSLLAWLVMAARASAAPTSITPCPHCRRRADQPCPPTATTKSA